MSSEGSRGRLGEDIWPIVCSPGTIGWDYFRKIRSEQVMSGSANLKFLNWCTQKCILLQLCHLFLFHFVIENKFKFMFYLVYSLMVEH